MRKLFKASGWLITGLILISLLLASCGSPDSRVFSLKEGIGHFSLEYPSEYSITRIDIRNDTTSKYTDIGFSSPAASTGSGLNEISIYAWPADTTDTPSLILSSMLAQGETIFPDFELLQRFSVMIGDMEGQAAVFSWTASLSSETNGEKSIPAVSRMVCFRHANLAWEIHVAVDLPAQDQAEAEFNHILETFQILN